MIPNQINERFKEFGEILEIDIKKPDYALVQFVDIKSVVRAIRAVDGEVSLMLKWTVQNSICFYFIWLANLYDNISD